MCSYLVTFLALCLTCQVISGQTYQYEQSSYPSYPVGSSPVNYYSDPAEQNQTHQTQNLYWQSQPQSPLNGTEDQDGGNQTGVFVSGGGSSNSIGGNYVSWSPDGMAQRGSATDQENISIGGTQWEDRAEIGANTVTLGQIGTTQLLWHVGVYTKEYAPYMQICGGTLVTPKAVISAAHCFWSDERGELLPATYFAVGAGKLYRPWDDPHDVLSQKSNVSALQVPVRYRDAATSYQDDIAVVMLANEIFPSPAIQLACVDFDAEFDDKQLREGNMGTILGWGLTKEDGMPSQILTALELPSVSIAACLDGAEEGFLRYITSDKICAGVTTGKALCRGDSGGGLVLLEESLSAGVPYLRGVASTAPRNEHLCNAHALAALTHVRSHRDFLRQHIPDLEEECEKHYFSVRLARRRPPPLNYKNMDNTDDELSVRDKPIQFNCNCFCNNTKT